ncbi:aldo/keto reductase [Chloroflexi bacterium TSY]|nr:aldo/keto reductase [Chloroflexi bacterium TSY]
MNPTEKKKLGRTDVELTQFGFGAASLGEIFELVSEEQAQATLQAAWANGVRYFDTAPFYGHGLSEHRVGSFLSQQPRHEFVLSTKVGRILKAPADRATFKAPFFRGGLPFDFDVDYTYDGIMRSYEDSLQRLRLNSIDLLVIHDLELGHHGEQLQTYRDQFSNSGWRAVEELRSTGEVRAVGAGANELEVIPYFLERFDLDFFILARQYTLLEQEALDEALPLCQARNVGIILASVFNSGILVTGPVEGAKYVYEDAPTGILEKVSQIEQVCRRHNVSLAAAAIQFSVTHPCMASVIPGALHPRQVAKNLGYFREEIPAALWADLKAAEIIREDAPTPSSAARA